MKYKLSLLLFFLILISCGGSSNPTAESTTGRVPNTDTTNDTPNPTPPTTDSISPTTEYIHYDFIQKQSAILKSKYSEILDATTIGKSVENRNLIAFKISDNVNQDENESAIILLGTYHAREWISLNTTYLILQELVTSYNNDASTAELINNSEIWIVPLVNPDGHEYSRLTYRLWRKNRRNNGDGTYGVDLNRNHSFNWGLDNTGSSNRTVSYTYRGTTADSEPETRAVRDLVLKVRPQILISYHNYSQIIIYPWGYTDQQSTPDDSSYDSIAKQISKKIKEVHNITYGTGQVSKLLYTANGDLTDWSYGELGILSFTIELRPASGSPGFLLPANQILPTFQENYNAISYIIRQAQEIFNN